jgi:hypothetical protein
MRPTLSYPDIWDAYFATLQAVAERAQKGEVSMAQAEQLLAQKRSDAVAEEQRRLLANRSVIAQENAAAAADDPRACMRIGYTISCF